MSLDAWVRQMHRWLSMAFALVVGAIFLALGIGVEPPAWLYYLPLPPLLFLLLSGLWLFALPYLGRRRVGPAE